MARLRHAGKALFELAVAGAAHSLLASRTVAPLHGQRAPAGTPALSGFCSWLCALETGAVLELGTRRIPGRPSTLRRDWAPRLRHVACDFAAGEDVDVVADAEDLAAAFAAGSFDAVIACSVFEHIRRPWLAAAQIAHALRPGGRVFIQTHNCFPIHAFPFDYWRFTREAMESLFGDDVGFCNRKSWYNFPVAVVNTREPSLAHQDAYLNVCLVAERRG